MHYNFDSFNKQNSSHYTEKFTLTLNKAVTIREETNFELLSSTLKI